MTKMTFKSDCDSLVEQMITDAKKDLNITDATFRESEKELKIACKVRSLFGSFFASNWSWEDVQTLANAMVAVKKGYGYQQNSLTQKESDALVAKVLSTTKGLNPLYVFEKRLKQVIADFGKTDGEKKDVAAFKRAFNLAQAECVNRYKAEGNSTAVDYLKAAGLMLLGALVAIITSPVLLFSADKRQDLGNFFFSGVDTDRSKLAQKQMKADAADSLLEEAAAAAA